MDVKHHVYTHNALGYIKTSLIEVNTYMGYDTTKHYDASPLCLVDIIIPSVLTDVAGIKVD